MYRAALDVSWVLSNVTASCAPVEKPCVYPRFPLKLFETSQFDMRQLIKGQSSECFDVPS